MPKKQRRIAARKSTGLFMEIVKETAAILATRFEDMPCQLCVRGQTLDPLSSTGWSDAHRKGASDEYQAGRKRAAKNHPWSLPLWRAHWTIHGEILDATICNCTACRRSGALWAYDYEGHGIHVTAPEDGLTAYVRGSGSCPSTSAGSAAIWFAGVAPGLRKMAARE